MSIPAGRFIKQFVPPVIAKLLQKRGKYGWRGDFKNWRAAQDRSGQYDEAHILDKVTQAALKVSNGEIAYERDSVLFDSIQYSWPLLSALLWIGSIKNGKLRVADFGGSLGSSYFQNRKFLSHFSGLEWNIVEQAGFVDRGKQLFQNEILQFYYGMDELIAARGLPDLLILSCVLPYLEKPYELLETLMIYKIPYVIIDNTYFNYENRDRICIQRVPPEIYSATYPCWMLDDLRITGLLTKNYNLISSHQNESTIFLDGKEIRYQGFLFKIKE